MVAGAARGAVLGSCFRPWCDKRRPRSRSRSFLGRPVRHPGASAVGARAATRHPGNKRQVLLLACLRACPRGGAPTALRSACVVTRLSPACDATQPRRLVCTHSLAIVIRCRRTVSPPTLCAPSRVHYVVSVLSRVNAVHTSLVHTCTYPMDDAGECTFAGSRVHLAAGRSPLPRASMYHTPRTALRALYHTCTMAWMSLRDACTSIPHRLRFIRKKTLALFSTLLSHAYVQYVDVMLVSRRLWGGLCASRATCCPPRAL